MKTFLATYDLYEKAAMGASPGPESRLPEPLRVMLGAIGGNSYAQGFFRFISADVFRPYFSSWRLDPAECFAFLKCGFGHLIFCHQEQYKVLDPVVNSVQVLGGVDELDFVMDIVLCDRPSVENTLLIDIYEQAVPRLGAPGIAEIYAFVPPIGMGGSRSASHGQKSKMSVEMAILSQL